MLLLCMVLVLCVFKVESMGQNTTCPVVAPREIDLKNLDGRWYLISIASEVDFQGECAKIVFSHKSDNTTDISISWISNNITKYYNGSVQLSFDPDSNSTEGDLLYVTYTDKKSDTFSFLALDYEHYAVVFACYNEDDGKSSTYELWELSRTPHVKPRHVSKIADALQKYNLKDAPLLPYNNTEACSTSSTGGINPSSIVLTLSAALVILRWLY